MRKKGFPAIADRAVWERVKEERAGIRWDSAVEKFGRSYHMRGNQEEVDTTTYSNQEEIRLILSVDSFLGVHATSKKKA